MICSKCSTINEENANSCINCGENLQSPKNESLFSNKLLFAFVIAFAAFTLIDLILNICFMGENYNSFGIYIIHAVAAFKQITLILPALAINNKAFKKSAVIIMAITVFILVLSHISAIISIAI